MSDSSKPKNAVSHDTSILEGVAPLESILCTEELRRRPSHLPDYEKEISSLVKLLNALANSPTTVLQTLAETVQHVMQCDSAGLGLLTRDGKTPDVWGDRFYWPAISGMWKPQIGRETPRNFSPSGDVLNRDCTLLFKRFDRRYTYLLTTAPLAEECLVVPFYVQGKAVGTLWAIMHSDRRRFDAEDERLMMVLGQFASSAYLAFVQDLKLQMAAGPKQGGPLRERDTNDKLDREIAEDKRAEDEQQARELNLRLLVNSIPAPAAVMTPSGKVETVNQPDLDYFGKTLEDLKHWDTSDAVHPDDLPGAISVWVEAIQTGQPYHVKERLRRFDGVYRWFEARGFPLRDPDGRILNWCVLLTDIDDRQRAEEKLRSSEQRWRAVFENSAIGVGLTDMTGRFLATNSAYQEMLGYSEAELRKLTFLELTLEDDRQRNRELLTELIDGKRSQFQIEKQYRRKDGRIIWVRNNVSLVPGTEDVPRFVMALSEDITERKQAEDTFRLIVEGTAPTTGSDFFQSLVRHMAQALHARYAFVTTCDDQKHARTLAFWKGNGFGANFEFDIADTPCEKVLHGEICHYRRGLQSLFQRDKLAANWQAESYLGVPMLDDSNRVIGHIAILDDKPMDIDARSVDLVKIFASRAAAELKRQTAEDGLRAALQEGERMREELAHLAHQNRVSTMGELAASLAHEIKQPISAAMTDANTCSRWLTRDNPDLEEAKAAASRVVKDVARASEIIGRVRSLFKKNSLQREEVDINELIQEMIALLRGEASRHSISIHPDLSRDLPPIMADRVQLQQVLMNLMLNSIEAMKSMNTPGKIMIKSKRDDCGQLLISVMDNGVGVPAEKTDRIFDAFFTSKPQGTGMGLPISRSIVESHGGRLWAVSDLDSGATFHLTLPTRNNAD